VEFVSLPWYVLPKLDGTPEQQCGDNIYSLIPAIVVAIFLLPPSAVVQCSGAAQ
jgi:hypothetical protein